MTHKSNRVVTSLQVTSSHRDVWSNFLADPSLARVTETDPDLQNHPITQREEYFVILVISHITAVYDAYRAGVYPFFERDIVDFLSLPIPFEVWQRIKRYQQITFSKFVDSLIAQNKTFRNHED